MCSVFKCFNEIFENIFCNPKQNKSNIEMENINPDINYQTIDIEDYWHCSQGNKHPRSQEVCRCYWEKISLENLNS